MERIIDLLLTESQRFLVAKTREKFNKFEIEQERPGIQRSPDQVLFDLFTFKQGFDTGFKQVEGTELTFE